MMLIFWKKLIDSLNNRCFRVLGPWESRLVGVDKHAVCCRDCMRYELCMRYEPRQL